MRRWWLAVGWLALLGGMAGAAEEGLRERGMRPQVLTPVTRDVSRQRWAVVVGVGDYANDRVADLRFAAPDAAAMAQYLLAEGGVPQNHLWQLIDQNATRDNLERVMGDELRRQVGPQDTVFVYFAGHGFATETGELVLMMHETDPDRLVSSGLTSSRLGEMLGYLGQASVAAFLDTCFSGGAGGRAFSMSAQRAGPAGSLGEKLRAGGRFIMTASRADEPAYEADAYGHGLFTWFLLEGLRMGDHNGDGQLTFAELFDHVYERVGAASKDRQHPDQTSAGNLLLATAAAAGPAAAGAVQVSTNPLGAKVYVDGLPAAGPGGQAVVSPTAALPVKAGPHRVAAHKAGFELTQQIVTVEANRTAEVHLDLRREEALAALLLTDLRDEWHGATVVLNRQPAAVVSGAELFLPGLKGEQATIVAVEKAGYQPFEKTVTLAAGEIGRLTVRLTPLPTGDAGSRPAGLSELGNGRFRWATDTAEMVWVPGGPTTIGTDDRQYFLAMPQHQVTLAGCWMDRCEVTVAQFRRFVAAAGYQPHGPWQNEAGDGRDEYPVVNVTLADAQAYAAWAGKALPTEIEWERAARGPDGWLYPYHAETFSEQKANVPRTRLRRTTPVGYFSKAGGDSPEGLADLSGNVAEWTASQLVPYPGHTAAADGRFSAALAVVRGGSFRSADSKLDTTAVQRIGVAPDRWAADIGFRCVLRPGR